MAAPNLTSSFRPETGHGPKWHGCIKIHKMRISMPLKKGLGIADVNVLYHSLSEKESKRSENPPWTFSTTA
jgi:hypothetical protein